MSEYFVCKVGELADGDVRIVEENGLEIGVIHQGNAYYAYQNLCPHQGGPACEGMRLPQVVDVIGEGGLFVGQRFDEADMHIVCPWHGYEYHLSSGEHVCNAALKLRKFEVSTRDGGIYVHI
jgi:nitrite reductase/ring-hydroxylating ferredoxin subunit